MGIQRGLESKEIAANRHAERIDPNKAEKGKTKAHWDEKLLAKSKPIEVTSGIYIDRITELSLPNAFWEVDFYIWFNWKGKITSPGKTFQIINGEIIKRELVNEETKKDRHHKLYRVKAKITKFFNTQRFPRDDHLLTINIEDKERQIYKLIYKPDSAGSAVSSRVKLPGYKIYKKELKQKFHSYKTKRGNHFRKNNALDTHSMLIYGVWIKRPDWGSYINMFEGLYAAVAVAMLSFFIPTTTTNRLSLGVGAFFASVAATYVATRNLPNTGTLTLTDIITGLSMLTIFLVLWHSIIATHLHEAHKDRNMTLKFNLHGFIIFFICYVITNAALAISSSI